MRECISTPLIRGRIGLRLGFLGYPEYNRLHILVNSGTGFGNTVKSAVLWQTGCNFPGKIYANGRYWEAEKGVPWFGMGTVKRRAVSRADQLVGKCSDAIEVWQFVESLVNGSPGFADVHKEVFAGGSDVEGVSWDDDSVNQFRYIPGAALLPRLQAVRDRAGSSPI